MIKERVTVRGAPDEISDVIGEQCYYIRYYFDELKLQVLGKHSVDLIPVSRFYPNVSPPVVVDFEPSAPDKMYVEEKRAFFMEKGYVYVPVFLKEILSKETFAKRLEDEREVLVRGYREALEDQALASEDDKDLPFYSDANLMAQINAEALEKVKALKLRGAAKAKRLAREKERIIGEYRAQRLKNGMGSSSSRISA